MKGCKKCVQHGPGGFSRLLTLNIKKMKIELATESTMISDTTASEVMEQPVVVENYGGGDGVSIVGWDGDSVYMSYRQVNEVCAVMKKYAAKKKKK
jgi:hypothetical protein